MTQSKCTCPHRRPSQNVRDWNFTHNETCYYYQTLREEREARAAQASARRLFTHYQRAARKARHEEA